MSVEAFVCRTCSAHTHTACYLPPVENGEHTSLRCTYTRTQKHSALQEWAQQRPVSNSQTSENTKQHSGFFVLSVICHRQWQTHFINADFSVMKRISVAADKSSRRNVEIENIQAARGCLVSVERHVMIIYLQSLLTPYRSKIQSSKKKNISVYSYQNPIMFCSCETEYDVCVQRFEPTNNINQKPS